MTAIVAAFAAAPLPATVANLYLWRVYTLDTTNWVLRAFAVGSTIVNVASLWFGFLAVRRLLGFDPIDWTPPASAVVALALELVPIYFAIEFRRKHANLHRRATDA